MQYWDDHFCPFTGSALDCLSHSPILQSPCSCSLPSFYFHLWKEAECGLGWLPRNLIFILILLHIFAKVMISTSAVEGASIQLNWWFWLSHWCVPVFAGVGGVSDGAAAYKRYWGWWWDGEGVHPASGPLLLLIIGGQHFAAALLHLATLCSRHCHTSTGPSAQPHFAVHLPWWAKCKVHVGKGTHCWQWGGRAPTRHNVY